MFVGAYARISLCVHQSYAALLRMISARGATVREPRAYAWRVHHRYVSIGDSLATTGALSNSDCALASRRRVHEIVTRVAQKDAAVRLQARDR